MTCASETGASTTTTSLAQRTAQTTLAAADTVTCTYTNRLTPPAGALVLRKVTDGGSGSFPFTVRDSGGRFAARPTLTTCAEGGVGAVRVIKLDPGRYTISETLPVTEQGTWRRTSVRCNGRAQEGERASVQITAGRGAVCTFTNTLERPGRIIVRGVTVGGLGAAVFQTSPLNNPRVQRTQTATSRQQGVPATASGQPTDELPFGRYVIQESMAVPGRRRRLREPSLRRGVAAGRGRHLQRPVSPRQRRAA